VGKQCLSLPELDSARILAKQIADVNATMTQLLKDDSAAQADIAAT
jgi:hypothetical protein